MISRLSLRLRLSLIAAAMVTLTVGLSSLVLVSLLHRALIDEIRTDDLEEIDRQISLLSLFDARLAATGQPLPGPFQAFGQSVAMVIVPDDGTRIEVSTADGRVLGSSERTLAWLGGRLDRRPDGIDAQPSAPATEATFDQLGLARNTIEAIMPHLLEVMFSPTDRAAPALGEGPTVTVSRTTMFLGEQVEVSALSDAAAVSVATRRLSMGLAAALPLLAVLAGAGAWRLTSLALRPVDRVIADVRGIESIQADTRISVPVTSDEISRLARTMNDLLDRIDALTTSHRRLIAEVSHELKTPVTLVHTQIEAAMHLPGRDWETTGQMVLAEMGRLSNLVDDLVMLSGLGASGPVHQGQLDLDRRELDLDDLVQTEVKRHRGHATVRVDSKGVEPTKIIGHCGQISRLVQNLLVNAVRHARSEVAVSLTREEGGVVLTVEDDGDGIAPENRELVFERFGRLGRAGGTGLGLTIVREVARHHGGDVIIDESPLGGARFTASLPPTRPD